MKDSLGIVLGACVVVVVIIALTYATSQDDKTTEIRESCADRGGRAFIEPNANWVCVSPDGNVIEAKR